ncbi:MAG: hypothetical protein HKN52_07495 [Eudoraea sp.]|nr:hypothetical protein [Eudoraea sp.]
MKPHWNDANIAPKYTNGYGETSPEYAISMEASYVLVRLHGATDHDAMKNIFKKIEVICEENNLKNVMVVSRMQELSGFDAFQLHLIIKKAGFTEDHKIAWVERNLTEGIINRFVLNVLTNHGDINTAIFSNEEDATCWFTDKKQL